MGAFDKSMASARMSFMEKYKYAYPEDLNFIRDFMGAEVSFSQDGKSAHVTWNNYDFTVQIRESGRKNSTPGYKPGSIIEI